MKITREMPVDGTRRSRKVFALIPMFFDHGPNNKPLRTMVWFDYYYVKEYYQYGKWQYGGKALEA